MGFETGSKGDGTYSGREGLIRVHNSSVIVRRVLRMPCASLARPQQHIQNNAPGGVLKQVVVAVNAVGRRDRFEHADVVVYVTGFLRRQDRCSVLFDGGKHLATPNLSGA